MKQTQTQSHSFTLALATSASVDTLEAWLDHAAPRARAIYASGVDFPRDSAAAALVRGWQEAGLVSLVSERDKADPRRTNWIVERCGVGVPGDAGDLVALQARENSLRSAETRAQLADLLGLLCGQAKRRRKCPSLSRLARDMDLGGSQRGRQRARYLLDLLVQDGAVRLGEADRLGQREVVILREKRA